MRVIDPDEVVECHDDRARPEEGAEVEVTTIKRDPVEISIDADAEPAGRVIAVIRTTRKGMDHAGGAGWDLVTYPAQQIVAMADALGYYAGLPAEEWAKWQRARLFESSQRWIQRPLSDLKRFIGELHDSLGDPPAVHWLECQSLENQKIKSASQ